MRPKSALRGVEPSDTPIQPEQVSLAIEGWNAAELASQEIFEGSLRSLLGQTFPIQDCEILVIVDAALEPGATSWIQDLLPKARILQLTGATYFRSKNLAIESARRAYLVFADSDVVYEPRWLASMLASLRPGVELVVGNTQFEAGFLSRTLNLSDWPISLRVSGYTDWFYGNNLAFSRQLFETMRFREDLGLSGYGSVNVLRSELARRGIRPWYCLEARGLHHLAPFWNDRLLVGAYQVHYRRLAPDTPWAWLVRVPLLGPFLVTAGTLLKAWRRAWRLRSTLPGRGLSLPVYLVTISGIKVVELLGALMVTWAPGWVDRRYGWFTVPPSTQQSATLEP
jgi:glycosyltransferase involved in cell wall biosynthesis